MPRIDARVRASPPHAQQVRERLLRPMVARLSGIHQHRRVSHRAHGTPPRGIRTERTGHPPVCELPDHEGKLLAQDAQGRAVRHWTQNVARSARRAVPWHSPRAPNERQDLRRAGSSSRRVLGVRRTVGIRRVLARAVSHGVARDESTALDRRTRWIALR